MFVFWPLRMHRSVKPIFDGEKTTIPGVDKGGEIEKEIKAGNFVGAFTAPS